MKVWDDQVSLRAIFRMTKIRTLNYPTSITWRSSYHLTNSNGGNKGSSLTPLNHSVLCMWVMFWWYIVLSIILKQHNMVFFGQFTEMKSYEGVGCFSKFLWLKYVCMYIRCLKKFNSFDFNLPWSINQCPNPKETSRTT